MPAMTKDQAEDFFGELFCGRHHIPKSGVKEWGTGWCVDYYGDLATYDADRLTRFVFLCHDRCVRGEIGSSGPRMVKLIIHARTSRDGDPGWDRHPTMEAALARWRTRHPGEVPVPISDALVRWLAGGRRGVSSNTIVQHLTGLPATRGFAPSHPFDAGDFGRCVDLLEACPELAQRLGDMRTSSPTWALLVDAWGELTGLLRGDGPSRDRCTQRIQELLAHGRAQQERPRIVHFVPQFDNWFRARCGEDLAYPFPYTRQAERVTCPDCVRGIHEDTAEGKVIPPTTHIVGPDGSRTLCDLPPQGLSLGPEDAVTCDPCFIAVHAAAAASKTPPSR